MVTGIGDGYLLQRLANDLAGQSTASNVPFCSACWTSYIGAHTCTGRTVAGQTTYPPALLDCGQCGQSFYGGHICPVPVPMVPPTAPACQHCWCGDAGAFNGKPHVACCMCGTRRVQ